MISMENNAKIFAKVFFPHLCEGQNVKIFAIPFGRAKIFTIMMFSREIFTFRPKCEDLRLTKLSSEDLHILTQM